MEKQMPVVTVDTAPTGMYKLASAYVDCMNEMGQLYQVESNVAANLVDERCGPMRARLQKMIDNIADRLAGLPKDGPVMLLVRALGIPAVVRKGKLKLL